MALIVWGSHVHGFLTPMEAVRWGRKIFIGALAHLKYRCITFLINSLLRYGVAVFLKPVYDEEDLKRRKLPQILLSFRLCRTV
jgi:hypothetical protein